MLLTRHLARAEFWVLSIAFLLSSFNSAPLVTSCICYMSNILFTDEVFLVEISNTLPIVNLIRKAWAYWHSYIKETHNSSHSTGKNYYDRASNNYHNG